jgi:hypothetical protein
MMNLKRCQQETVVGGRVSVVYKVKGVSEVTLKDIE